MSQAMPAANPQYSIVSLQDVQTHLRMPPAATSDDASLMNFIYAATDVLQQECSDIVPQQYDEYYDGGDFSISTRHTPILNVVNVQEGWGWTNYDLEFAQVNSINATNIFAYSLDNPTTGLITRRSGGNVNIRFIYGESNIRITYVAGREKVPSALKLAALELIAHWWQGSQLRAAQYQPEAYDIVNQDYSRTLGGQEFSQGVPYRILELIKPYRHMPIIG